MTHLKVGNVWTEVDAAAEVSRLLSFKPRGYKFAPSFKNGNWDGTIKLARTRNGKTLIPSGLVPWLQTQPGRWEVEDMHLRPPAGFSAGSSWLYDHQMQVALDPHQEAAVVSAIQAGQGIIQYPTGVGKGRIIGEVVRRLNVRALVICDKLDLLRQLDAEVSNATGRNCGIAGGNQWVPGDATIAKFQTLSKRLKDNDPDAIGLLKQTDLVIVDEAHHAAAKGLGDILKLCPAFYRFGLSATAFKSYAGKSTDRGTFLQVQAFLGPPIESMTISEGINTGRIVGADVFVVHGCIPDPTPTINYKEEYQQNIVDNIDRNSSIVSLARKLVVGDGTPTVILVSRIDHGEILARFLVGFAGGAPFIHGGTKPKDRQAIYDEFKQHGIPILIIGKLGDEAIDLPNIGALILAGGGNSPHVQIQRIGRSLRASNGKDRAMVFDYEDYGKYLAAHYRRRRRTYDAEPAYVVIDIERGDL